jgi:predicted permease
MSLRSRLQTWWRAVTDGAALDREVDEELRFHIELYAEDLMRSGLPREEAMRRARVELGSIAAGKENCRQAQGTRFFDELRADLRYALRMLRKTPGFTAIAIGSLALGIGVNTVIFTAAQHMLLDRLQVPHPEQLRLFEWTQQHPGVVESLWGWFDDNAGGVASTSFSYPVYKQLRRGNQSLAEVFAFKPYGRMTATIDGQPETVDAEIVSGNYYSSLEIRPQLGRGIDESDDSAVGSGPVVVISDKFWARRWGHSQNVIGKTILVNATPLTIVGVNPPGFTGAYSAQGSPDIFLPFSMQPVVAPQNFNQDTPRSLLVSNNMWWVLVMGRVKPGVPDATAAASLNVLLGAAVRSTMTVKDAGQIPRLFFQDGSRGQNPNAEGLTKPLYVLMGLSGFVLLLACANLANLLLARAGARQREISVRLALGAGRARILRQMITESLLLSLMGGIAGLLLAWTVHNAIPRLLSHSWDPPAFAARLSWPILAFAAGISVLTGLIFGLAPAWQAARVQVSSGLKDSGQTVTHRRRGLAGKTIVAIQVGLSTLLVIGAGLFTQSLMRLGRSPLGFRSHQVLLFSVQLPETRYPDVTSLAALQRMEEKLSAVPGVESVTLMRLPLISGNAANGTFVPEGHTYKREDRPSVLVNDVGQDFFRTFSIPILAGRGFNAADTATSRKVAVVNESLAKKFFPDLDPIGRTFQAGWNHPVILEIVGVCADTKYYSLRKNAEPTYYAPYEQKVNGLNEATFAVATRMEGQSILPSLRDAVRTVDRNLPLLDVRTQDEQILASLQSERIFAALTGGFGVLALLLACIGIYGIMAYAVSQRTNEIGIRMALGAQPARVLRMVLRDATQLTVVGIAVGLTVSLAMGKVVASLLYGLKFWDPATLVCAALLLAATAIAASWIPARRAASVDPMRALRHE